MLHGEPVRRQVTLHSGRNGRTVQLSVNYDNAVAAVERSLRSDNERTRRLVQRFLITRVCSVCHGTRLRPEALSFAARRPQPRRDQRARPGRAARVHGRPARGAARRAQPADHRPARRAERQAHAAARRRAGLPDPRPGRRLAVDGGAAADRAHLDGARQHHGHAVRAGRAVGRAAPEQRRRAAQDASPPWPGTAIPWSWWSTSGRSSAPRTGSSSSGPRPGAKGGTVIAQGTPGQLETDPHSIIGPFLAGAAAVPPGPSGAGRSRRADHHRDRRPVQPARRHRRLPGAPADRAGRAVRGREDRPRPGQPHPGRAGAAERVGAARARPPPGPRRHPPGRPGRRLADRPERAVDARDLLRGVRPDPPRVRRVRVRPAAALEARALLVQHPRGPVPDLPRARPHRPRRPVPARHHRPVPDLPRRPLQRRHPGRPGRRPDHRRRARPERARRPGAVRRPGPGRRGAAARRARSAWVTCGWASPRRPCPAASRSGCGSPPGCAAASAARCTSSTSRPPACTRSTWPPWSACSTGCWTAGATIIVIDHDLDLLAAADHLIDMGPGGGPDGGHILAAGHARGRRAGPGQRDRAVAGRAPGPAGEPRARRPVSPSEPIRTRHDSSPIDIT